MNLAHLKKKQLPLADLERIGLASAGQLLLNMDDLKALLSGRRTDMLHLENLQSEKTNIKALQAKISLNKGPDGKIDLLIHPVYLKPARPAFLEEFEGRDLEKGKIANLLKVTTDKKGNKREVLVEYDKKTKEFIVSDTELILAPDMVNSEFLTPAQKQDYRKGKEVQLADSTRFAYSAADSHGIRSNKIALIVSILIDGGLSFVLCRGLNALFNKKHDPEESKALSPGYFNALRDMENQRQAPAAPSLEESLHPAVRR